MEAGGWWNAVCYNPDGSMAWKVRRRNRVVKAARTDVLAVYLAAGTQKTSWYLGLIDSSGYSALSDLDTMSSHSGWTEFTSYSESTRQQWLPGPSLGPSLTNPAGGVFTISAGGILRGAFLVSDSTRGGTSGVLYATGLFTLPQVVVAGQQLKVQYTPTLQASA